MKRFQLLTTAIFLFCTLLIAGCTGRGVEAQTTPAPEATPTATTNIQAGIQTGDNEVNKILAGTWAFERTDAEKKADDSVKQLLPEADTGAKTATEIKEPGTIRELMFRVNGTGSYTDADGAAQAFEFALNGDNLTLALENGTVQMFRCTLENGLMYLTPMSNNGAYQAFTGSARRRALRMRPQTESAYSLRPDAAASGRISFFAISEKFQDFPRDLCYNQAHPQRERRPHMSRKKRKRGRGRVLILVVLLALIVFGVFARGIFTSGKTTTEHAQRELHTYAEQHETSLADYPDALVQLYARNPDARDFVRDYPKKKNLTPTIDLSNLSGSKTVPLLLQWDERWGYREYNESIIGLAGCGPTCLSMATIYLTGDTTKDPLWMCRFAEQNQFNVPGSGSKWALISEGGRMLGLDVTQIPLDKDRIYRNLDVGNPIIVVVGPGDFTTDGHFLVLTGHSGDKITLNDPNSPTNSAKSWDYDTLAGQIQALWVLRRAG